MKNVYIIRTTSSNQGTQGTLVTEGFNCFSLELPWRDNQQNISCIPAGEYIVKIRQSPRFGKVYWVTKVPNRGYILIHPGNFAGDVSKRYKSNVEGCLLLGKRFGILGKQLAVLTSRITVRRFMEHMEYETFKLNIIGNIGEI